MNQPTPPAEHTTPITDSVAFDILHNPYEERKRRDGDYVAADVSRMLERQLAEAKEENQRLTADMILHERMSIQFMEQRDTLAGVLRQCDPGPDWVIEPELADWAYFCELSVGDMRRIRSALAALDS